MNTAQRRALAHPIYLACETLTARSKRSAQHHSEIITINAGYE